MTKKYKWGFVLTEQELRRIINICNSKVSEELNGEEPVSIISAKLRNGSQVNSSSVDSILALENGSSKQIEALRIQVSESSYNSDYQIEITFQDAKWFSNDWTSVEITILGESKDWVFVTLSELEERIKKVRRFSVTYLINDKWFYLFILSLGTILTVWVLTYFSPARNAVDLLEQQYKNGQITDPIEAIIFLQKEQRKAADVRIIPLIILSYVIPGLVAWIIGIITPKLYPPYNFCWGDYLTTFNKLQQRLNIFWVVIVLGIIVSLLGSYIFDLLRN